LRDQADVVELLRENPNRVVELRKHLKGSTSSLLGAIRELVGRSEWM